MQLRMGRCPSGDFLLYPKSFLRTMNLFSKLPGKSNPKNEKKIKPKRCFTYFWQTPWHLNMIITVICRSFQWSISLLANIFFSLFESTSAWSVNTNAPLLLTQRYHFASSSINSPLTRKLILLCSSIVNLSPLMQLYSRSL